MTVAPGLSERARANSRTMRSMRILRLRLTAGVIGRDGILAVVRNVGAVVGAACVGACGLIVGDPHGLLPEPDASNAGDAGVPPHVDAMTGCGAGDCETSAGPGSCGKGGCNATGGACISSGLSCYCDNDTQCTTGKCVSMMGQNDRSCSGTSCTGTGAADGFGCQLPPCTTATFGYAPSNFKPSSYTAPTMPTTDCNGTYDSSAHTFTAGGCGGQIPNIVKSVAQTGAGQAVDILLFQGLTIASTSTFTLVGANPVILAVYGDAAIHGVIDASASGGTPGAGGNACVATSPSADAGTGSWEPGGGGGGQSSAGGVGGMSRGAAGGPAGRSQGNGTAPLSGGCSGELPALGLLGFTPTVGAGGGGVQISAAGVLDLTNGTVKANGSKGGDGESGKCATYYPAQNGTGGAGGGSGGSVLVEGTTVVSGTITAQGGTGGAGGPAPTPNLQPGGAGGTGGAAGGGGGPGGGGTQKGSAPSGCTWGGYWSGGGGGGGAGGYVKTNQAGGACSCKANTDCSTGYCSNVSSQCTGMCSGSVTAGTYDSIDCQTMTSTP